MRNFPIIIIIFLMIQIISCKSIDKKEKKLLVKKSINESLISSEKALAKLGKEFKNQLAVSIGYEIQDKENTIIKIESASEKLISLTKNAILQELYLGEGGVLPKDKKYSPKSIWWTIGLGILNSGLGMYYTYDNHVYGDNASLKWFLAIGYGLWDAGGTALFINGIKSNQQKSIIIGLANMLIAKGMAMVSIGSLKLHNEIISSGYNFDDNNVMYYTFLEKEF